MKNWINKMSKEKAQRFLFIGVLILVFSVFFISLSLLEPKEKEKKPPIDNNNDDDDDDIIVYETIVLPIKGTEFETIRKFWSYDAPTEDQEKSIIVFGSKYYMSKGVSYSQNNEEFEVIACLSGTVTKVTDSPIYGQCVTIDHGDGIVSEYMSLGSVLVKEGDKINQGSVIGNGGTNEYDSMAGIHIHFQLKYKSKAVNPELLFGKKVNEIASIIE
ncbi:MAG: M23 family metallopeptidase [Bacilli bacterium]|nr:M23 family metallopeptidase [Bacilli bacterium]MDD4076489.1 M23 family metallopeptidase [Bacilli bacterium]MDD4387760.1 M23 family metallopeptidase [Bacilli bacterium]